MAENTEGAESWRSSRVSTQAEETGRNLFAGAYEGSDRTMVSDRTSIVTGDANAPKQWTVAIDLTAAADFGSAAGAPNQLRRIQELAEQTGGSSVNLVVQIAADAADPDAHRLPSSKGGTMPGKDLHRYLISNGQITELETVPSEGFAHDVQSLLETAGAQAPSERLALIMQSHGGGTDGLQGDTGTATMPQFVDAVRNGLASTGREKLDLIDFDACSMGSTSVLQQMSQVADHMVASAEMEHSAKDAAYDAQNLQLTLSRLLQNPNIDGATFGGDMVRQADEGANDGFNSISGRVDTGTPTLAHFDLRHVQEFDARLSDLGHELAEAARSPANQAAIHTAIEQTPVLPQNGVTAGLPDSSRDLKTFVDKIAEAIDKGTIEDADGSLSRSIEAFRRAQSQVEPEYHGATSGGYDQMGGLNAFLPTVEFLDPDRGDSRNRNPVSQMSQMTEADNPFARYENKELVVRNITNSLQELRTTLGTTHGAGVQQLADAIKDVSEAANEEDFTAAISNLHAVTEQLSNSQFGQDLNAAVNRRTRDRIIEEEAIPEIPGWQELVEVLRSNF